MVASNLCLKRGICSNKTNILYIYMCVCVCVCVSNTFYSKTLTKYCSVSVSPIGLAEMFRSRINSEATDLSC